MNYQNRATIVLILLSMLFLPISTLIPSASVILDDFGNGEDVIEIEFSEGGSKVVELPVYTNASYDYFSFDVNGEALDQEYPSNIALDVGDDGEYEWVFSSKLGLRDTLDNQEETHRFDFSEDVKFENDESFTLPLEANITSATFTVSPKVTMTETMFVNIGPFYLMDMVEDELWFTGRTEGIVSRDSISEFLKIYTSDDGLNNSHINTISADEDFVYAGSLGGGVTIFDRELNTFSAYRWDENNGLASNNITLVHSTGDQVYIATDSSVQVFNKYGDFGSFSAEYWTPANSGLMTLDISDIVVSDTKVFFGTKQGLFIYEITTGEWTSLNTAHGLASNNVTQLEIDEGCLYIATAGGLSAWDYTGNRFDWHAGQTHLTGTVVSSLAQNETVVFAVVSSVFHTGSEVITRIRKTTGTRMGDVWFQGNTIMESEDIYHVLSSNNSLYITTPNGFHSVDLKTDTFNPSTAKVNQIPSNDINHLMFEDETNLMYLSTNNGGVGIYDTESFFFQEPWNKQTGLPSNNIMSVEASSDEIYMLTDNYGVYRWDRAEEGWLPSLDLFSGLSSNDITIMVRDGHILYLGNNKGVDRYNTTTRQMEDVWTARDYFNSSVSDGLLNNDIMIDGDEIYIAQSVTYDEDDEIVSGGGVWLHDRVDSTWTHISVENGGLSDNNATSLAHNSTHVFIGTVKGLDILDKRTGNITAHNHIINPELMCGAINSIYVDESTSTIFVHGEPIDDEMNGSEYGGGLLIISGDDLNVTHHFNSTNTLHAMRADDVNDMVIIDDILYLASKGSGLMRLDLETMSFLDCSPSMGDKQYPSGVKIDIGDDGVVEWFEPVFWHPHKVDITNALRECLYYTSLTYTAETNVELGVIPLNISVALDSFGAVIIKNIDIQYDILLNTGDLSAAICSYIESQEDIECRSTLVVPLGIHSDTPGKIILSRPQIQCQFSNSPMINVVSPKSISDGHSYWDTVPIEFDATGTLDPDGDPIEFLWSSNNDTMFQGNAMTFTSMLSVGAHTITLNVTDSKGQYATRQIDILVRQNRVPHVNVSSPYHNQTFLVDEEIKFASLGTQDPDGQVISYSWFANSAKTERTLIGNVGEFTHSFELSGVYNITLTISDGSLSAEEHILIIIIPFTRDARTWKCQSLTMDNVPVSYYLVHSSYTTSELNVAPVEVSGTTVDYRIPSQLTHIGVAFTIDQHTNGTIFNESVNISYSSQAQFLHNILEDTLELYYYNGSTGSSSVGGIDPDEWIRCPAFERNVNEKYLNCSIDPALGLTDGKGIFVLLANKSTWLDSYFSIDMISPVDLQNVDPLDLTITIVFSNNIIDTVFNDDNYKNNLKFLDSQGIPQKMLYTPMYDELGRSLSFRVIILEYDSDYSIQIGKIVDEYRHVEHNWEMSFHTMEETVEVVEKDWTMHIVVGCVSVLVLSSLVIFFVARRKMSYDDYDEDEGEPLSCPRCGYVSEEDEEICPDCGHDLEEMDSDEDIIDADFMKCPDCGKKIDKKSQICPFCSISLVEEISEEEEEVEEPEVELPSKEEAEKEVESKSSGAPEDMACPTCGEMVEKGTVECPACGDDDF